MRHEQIKAREYLYQKGTLLPPREIHERVKAAFVATEEFLNGVSPAEARQRPAPEEWCVQEVVDHLVETHGPSIDELRCLLRGERPPGKPIPAGLQSEAPLERPWQGLVGELGRLHTEAKRQEMARQAYQAARQVIEGIKGRVRNPGLRASLESAPLIRQVYDLSAS